jgi:quinoprotein glucose dehydrogenase
MTAIDLNTGDHLWMVPTGAGAAAIREHPALAGVALPPLGGQGMGGPLLTNTLLIHALALGRSEGAALVAYDRDSGAERGRVALPAVPTGTPMTYSVDDRQYIAVPVASNPPRLVALALP